MKAWLSRFEALTGQTVVLACIIQVILVGLLDYVSGYETFFFTFYLIPIFWGTWRVSMVFGGLISALSVAAWVSANIKSGETYPHIIIPVWNAGIMFTIYVIIVFLLSRLKKNQEQLEQRVRLRTEALTHEIQERLRLQREILETTDREQRRIGRDLHDGLCQHLTGTALAGHLLEQKLAGRSPDDTGAATRVVQLIEEAIEMTRNLSHQLDPVELKSGQLTDHLEDLAKSVQQQFKAECRFEQHLARPVDNAAVATHFYRLAQTAVVLAAKDRQAKSIKISLDSVPGKTVLTIIDDGLGRREPLSGDAAAALRAMTYRAEIIGATFHIEPLAARGTRVTCMLPTDNFGNAVKN